MSNTTVNHAKHYVEGAALASSIIMYVFGTMGTLFVLMIVLAAGQHVGLTQEEQAQLASIDLMGYVVGTLIAVALVRKYSWRHLITVALLLAIIFNGAGHFANSFVTIAAARFLVEIGSGMTLALGMAAFGDSRKPDRSYAIALAILMTISWGVLMILPQYLEALGPSGVYFVHMGFAVLTLPFVLWFPKSGAADLNVDVPQEKTPPVLLIAMAAILFYMIAEGGLWAQAAVLGEDIGLGNQEAGDILGWSLVVSAIGATIAAVLSTTFGRFLPKILGLFIFGSGLLFLLSDSKEAFIAGMFITQGLFGFLPPYLMLTCCDYDPTNRYAAFIPAIQIFGYAAGPGIMSLFIPQFGLAPAIVYVGLAAVGLSILLSIPLSLHLDTKQRKYDVEENDGNVADAASADAD